MLITSFLIIVFLSRILLHYFLLGLTVRHIFLLLLFTFCCYLVLVFHRVDIFFHLVDYSRFNRLLSLYVVIALSIWTILQTVSKIHPNIFISLKSVGLILSLMLIFSTTIRPGVHDD